MVKTSIFSHTSAASSPQRIGVTAKERLSTSSTAAARRLSYRISLPTTRLQINSAYSSNDSQWSCRTSIRILTKISSFLVTHLYHYFGALMGCTYQGYPAFPAYAGAASMYQVHKFMDLNFAQNKYFIDQHVVAAESLGFSAADGKIFSDNLYGIFSVRCGGPTSIIKTQGPQLQSTCLTSDCPQAEDAECDLYPAASAKRSSEEECSEAKCRQHLEL